MAAMWIMAYLEPKATDAVYLEPKWLRLVDGLSMDYRHVVVAWAHYPRGVGVTSCQVDCTAPEPLGNHVILPGFAQRGSPTGLYVGV